MICGMLNIIIHNVSLLIDGFDSLSIHELIRRRLAGPMKGLELAVSCSFDILIASSIFIWT